MESVPDGAGLRGACTVELPSGPEQLSAGVAVHRSDVGGETERNGLGLLDVARSDVGAYQARAVTCPVAAVGLRQGGQARAG